MDITGFYHETKSRFAYPVDLQNLHIRLRTGINSCDKTRLIVFDPYEWEKNNDGIYRLSEINEVPMGIEQTTMYYDWWFATVFVPTKRCKYGFVVEKAKKRYLYGPYGLHELNEKADFSSISSLFYLYPYILAKDLFCPPNWVNKTIWYQIFPERYANSGNKNLIKPKNKPWNDKNYTNENFYGGDIPGITAHLDEIQEMGFNGIYMTPIFASPSTHKYNTEDYFQIDPAFGNNALLLELVEEAHKRGIKIMLDMVFNHIGSTNPIWQDVVKKGKASAYYKWFYINNDGSYETFGKVIDMPKWNADNPQARKYLIDIASYWVRTFNIDGLRLDVANEVSHDLWRVFRKKMRKINKEIYIVGEVCDNGTPWLNGDQFDSVMNYPLSNAIWSFVNGDNKACGIKLKESMSNCLLMYPKNRQEVMFNLIGCHDNSRIYTLCKGHTGRVMQAFTLLLTYAGSPMVFYGDEVGIRGSGMDDARKPMVWDDTNRDMSLRTYVKKLISLRKKYDEMRQVDITWLKADDEGLIFQKGKLYVILNCCDINAMLPLPKNISGHLYKDLINGEKLNLTNEISLEPYDARLLYMVT